MDTDGLICKWDYSEKSLDTQYSINPLSKKILEKNFDIYSSSKKPVNEKILFPPIGMGEDYMLTPFSLPMRIKEEIERYSRSFNIDLIQQSAIEKFVIKNNIEVYYKKSSRTPDDPGEIYLDEFSIFNNLIYKHTEKQFSFSTGTATISGVNSSNDKLYSIIQLIRTQKIILENESEIKAFVEYVVLRLENIKLNKTKIMLEISTGSYINNLPFSLLYFEPFPVPFVATLILNYISIDSLITGHNLKKILLNEFFSDLAFSKMESIKANFHEMYTFNSKNEKIACISLQEQDKLTSLNIKKSWPIIYELWNAE